MHNTSVAEWIIGRFSSKDRAASIMGDLIEAKPQRGAWWFRLSVVAVVFSLTWRRLVAFVVAFYAGAWANSGFQMAVYRVPLDSQHRAPDAVIRVLGILCGAGAILWMVLLYAAIRYGLFDKLTQHALTLVGLITVVIYFWWQPVLLWICIALSIPALFASLYFADRRKAALAIFITLAAGFSGGLLAIYLVTRYQTFIYPGPMGDVEMRAHPSIAWMGFLMFILAAWMTTTACSWTHRWLIEKKPDNSEASLSSSDSTLRPLGS